MHIMMRYGSIWEGYSVRMDLSDKAIPYLEHAYKITGDVPGINYLLASFYLHTRNYGKSL